MPRLKILIVGEGNLERAIYSTINNSDFAEVVFTTNQTSYCSETISYSNYDDLAQKALKKGIELVFVTSHDDINSGIIETLNSYGLKCIGTSRKYSRLGSSEIFARKFMDKYDIKYIEVNKLEQFADENILSVTSFYNGEKLINFEPVNLKIENNIKQESYCPIYLSYEKYDKLQNYLTRLEHALLEDDAFFNGFITSNLIWNNETWEVYNFAMTIEDLTAQTLLTHMESDFLSTILFGTQQKYKEKTTGSINLYLKNQNIKNELPMNENIKIYNNSENINNTNNDTKKLNPITLTTTGDFPIKALKDYTKTAKLN